MRDAYRRLDSLKNYGAALFIGAVTIFMFGIIMGIIP